MQKSNVQIYPRLCVFVLPKLWINNLVGRVTFIDLINVYHAGFVPRAFNSAEVSMVTKTE